MYALLLIVGAVVTAAGIALVGSGVSIQEHTFDPAILTPGAVGVVGGLIVMGLGFALRTLGRIERALMRPPIAPTIHLDEPATKSAAAELPAIPAMPFPPKTAAEPEPTLPEIPAAPKLPEDAAVDRLREQFPTLVRLENHPVVEETDVSLSPKPPLRADEEVAALSRQSNGAAPARPAPRLEVTARGPVRRERPKNLDTVWPKRPRPGQQGQAAAAQPAVSALPIEPVLAVVPAQSAEPAAEAQTTAAAPEMPTPVSILKSGVVDGMAYTLYSDGSIEAQLPQGTLRFGSIADLRTHIEQSA
jgi:hypothetical protein